MKGNKKILVIAVLLLMISVSFTTYAIYKSSATGSATINTANWVVSVGGTNIVENNEFTLGNITWNGTTNGKNNKIAPGDSGTVSIVIDADGSEVDVDYAITVGSLDDNGTTITNSALTAVAHSGSSLTGTIPYSATEGGMERTITLDVTWTATDDDETQNPADVASSGKALTLPITVTASQHIGS